MKTIKNETNDNSKKSSKKVLSFHYKQLTLRFGSNRNEKEKKNPALQKMTKKCYITYYFCYLNLNYKLLPINKCTDELIFQ